MSEKTCPECGVRFDCESGNDCWCESFHIHKKEMMEILSSYKDCLCPSCLSRFAEK